MKPPSMTIADWELLNAYVDGALSRTQRADIAEQVAQDSAWATAVADLTRLKAASGAALQPESAPDIDLGMLGRHAGRRTVKHWIGGMALAASLVLVLVGGLVLSMQYSDQDTARAWIEAATEQHTAWMNADADSVTALNARDTVVNRAGLWTPIPDLLAAKLSLSRVIVSPAGPKAGLFAGYTGRRGCQIGLWIGKAPEGLTAARMDYSTPGMARYAWRVGDTGYAVMAVGMDEIRLADIVAHLQEWSQKTVATQVAATSIRHAPCIV
ncbi:MAG: hypothetical protein KJ904_01405 [Alphaproteobacteria bacterium]|nr:hypothetical protein [Alphaproteobacteria bacterium]MBU0796841.1 hypothetical protein [Alphaproteobacteria bacterium]MBU0885801.1 hypothetical protein [Alphaproteobacteria bacterium]MBU1812122.1 hypothetical protein [Alphaproteobacteria bacterium]